MNLTHPLTKVTTTMNPFASLKAGLHRALLVVLLALPLALAAAEQRTFATPEAAVDALATALKANDERALIEMFGEKYKQLISTGSPADDAARRAEAATWLDTYRRLDDSAPDRRVLLVGDKAWPFPIPLVREGSAWRFATERGAEEVLNRRVYVSPSVDKEVLRVQMERTGRRDDAQTGLTPHQREVLRLLAEGKSLKEVAASLKISVKTVEFHKYRIMNQLGIRTNAEMTKYAVKVGVTHL